MFNDETGVFTDDVSKLGHYLGSSINVNPAMTMKTLTKNGQVLHRSSCRLLTPDEVADKDGSDAQEKFMVRVHKS